jgi:hypothetical protein
VNHVRLLLAAGTVGSGLIALGSAGVGALPPGNPVGRALGLDALRTSLSGLALGLCVVGLLVLAAAWWRARSLAPRELLAAAGMWSLPLLVAPPLLSRDLYVYAGQAALAGGGLDPYDVGPSALPGEIADSVDPVWGETPSPYGPLYLGLAGLVVRAAGDDPTRAALGLRLLAALGVALLAWGLLRLVRSTGVPAGQALWLGVANPLVLLHLVGGGHNDALMLGLLVAGTAVALTVGAPWRLVAATVLVTLAVLVKVPAVVGLAFLPLTVPGGWAARFRAGGVVAGTALVTAVVVTVGSGLGWGWLGTLGGVGEVRSLFSPMTGLGTALPGGDTTLDATLAAGLLLAGLLAVVLWLRAPRVGVVLSLGLVLLVCSLLLPVVQPWYLLWGVVVLAAAVGARAATALAVASLVLCLLVLPSGRSVIRPPLYGLPTLLAVAAAAVVLRRSEADTVDTEASARTPSS